MARGARRGNEQLDAAIRLLIDEGDGSSSLREVELVARIAEYARAPDEAIAKKARAALARFVRANKDREDQTTLQHVATALSAVATGGEPASMKLLRDVLASSAPPALRGAALEHLARRGGAGAKGWLVERLADPSLRSYAAKALAETAANTRDAACTRP